MVEKGTLGLIFGILGFVLSLPYLGLILGSDVFLGFLPDTINMFLYRYILVILFSGLILALPSFAILGVVLSSIQIKKEPNKKAIAGLIISVITLIWVVGLLIWIMVQPPFM